jgi:hypothetical protein
MLKPPIAALIALSLICSSHADAQDQPTPEAVATAKELIVTLRISDEFVRSLPGMLQVIKALIIRGRPEIELDFDAAAPVVLDAMKARVNELWNRSSTSMCGISPSAKCASWWPSIARRRVRNSWISRLL